MPKTTDKKKKTTVKSASFVYRWRRLSRKSGKGGVLRKTAALGRLIRWPKYVKLQRQRKVLLQRLKVPPALNVFANPARAQLAKPLFALFANYLPETRKQKRDRHRAQAKLEAEKKPLSGNKPILLEYGFNRVTNLIENGKAKLVLIAHDVDPIELVLWMPTLCVKKNIPFAVVKSKARLGTLCHKKTAACVALCEIDPKNKMEFDELSTKCRERFNERLNVIKKKGTGRVLGMKTRHKIIKRQRLRREEMERRKEAQKDKEQPKKRGGK